MNTEPTALDYRKKCSVDPYIESNGYTEGSYTLVYGYDETSVLMYCSEWAKIRWFAHLGLIKQYYGWLTEIDPSNPNLRFYVVKLKRLQPIKEEQFTQIVKADVTKLKIEEAKRWARKQNYLWWDDNTWFNWMLDPDTQEIINIDAVGFAVRSNKYKCIVV